MRVQEFMTRTVVTIRPDEAATTAWARMDRRGIRHLIVTEGKQLVGVLSERDLGGRSGADLRKGRLVRDLMTPKVAVAKPTTTLRQAANLMRGRLIGSLPVVEDGRVVGIVTATDVLDELGRGATRPAVRAPRRDIRRAPPAAREAERKSARGRGAATRAKRGAKALPRAPRRARAPA